MTHKQFTINSRTCVCCDSPMVMLVTTQLTDCDTGTTKEITYPVCQQCDDKDNNLRGRKLQAFREEFYRSIHCAMAAEGYQVDPDVESPPPTIKREILFENCPGCGVRIAPCAWRSTMIADARHEGCKHQYYAEFSYTTCRKCKDAARKDKALWDKCVDAVQRWEKDNPLNVIELFGIKCLHHDHNDAADWWKNGGESPL